MKTKADFELAGNLERKKIEFRLDWILNQIVLCLPLGFLMFPAAYPGLFQSATGFLRPVLSGCLKFGRMTTVSVLIGQKTAARW